MRCYISNDGNPNSGIPNSLVRNAIYSHEKVPRRDMRSVGFGPSFCIFHHYHHHLSSFRTPSARYHVATALALHSAAGVETKTHSRTRIRTPAAPNKQRFATCRRRSIRPSPPTLIISHGCIPRFPSPLFSTWRLTDLPPRFSVQQLPTGTTQPSAEWKRIPTLHSTRYF